MIRAKSKINLEYLNELRWQLQIENWSDLNARTGISQGYIYRLLNGHLENVTLKTIDKIVTALIWQFREKGLPPPGDLWHKLIQVDYTADEE